MNKDRRLRLQDLTSITQDAIDQLQEIIDEEQEAFDNLPESFQESSRGEAMQEWIDNMKELSNDLDEWNDRVNELVAKN